MIVVGGEALIDLVPQQGDGAWRALPGGSPCNAAVAAARLGHPTRFLGRLSVDAFGREIRAKLADSHVDLGAVVDAGEPATLAVVTVADDGAATYGFYLAGTSDFSWRADDPAELPEDCSAVHVGSLGAVLEPAASVYERMVRAAPRSTVRSFDPNVRPALPVPRDEYKERMERWVSISDVVRTSDEDLAWLYPDESPVEAARRWNEQGPAVVVVTCGASGVVGLVRGEEVRVPAGDVSVVDTVGAGDSFSAGLLVGLAERGLLDRDSLADLTGESLTDCLRFAADVAAVTCSRPGADPPWRDEVRDIDQ